MEHLSDRNRLREDCAEQSGDAGDEHFVAHITKLKFVFDISLIHCDCSISNSHLFDHASFEPQSK